MRLLSAYSMDAFFRNFCRSYLSELFGCVHFWERILCFNVHHKPETIQSALMQIIVGFCP